MEVFTMKKLSKIIITLLMAATISPTALAAEIPVESAPCNATIGKYRNSGTAHIGGINSSTERLGVSARLGEGKQIDI